MGKDGGGLPRQKGGRGWWILMPMCQMFRGYCLRQTRNQLAITYRCICGKFHSSYIDYLKGEETDSRYTFRFRFHDLEIIFTQLIYY